LRRATAAAACQTRYIAWQYQAESAYWPACRGPDETTEEADEPGARPMTRHPHVIYVVDDTRSVTVHFSREGMRGSGSSAAALPYAGEGHQQLERELTLCRP